MRTLSLIFCTLVAAAGCAYPRHTTLVQPAPASIAGDTTLHPDDMYALKVVEADLPQRQVSGLPWDADDDSAADPFVRIYLDDRKVWESEVLEDAGSPHWDAELPKNLLVTNSTRFRLEVWDHDSAGSADPMGRVSSTGLPATALPGAVARVSLDNKGTVTLLVSTPRAHRGVGLTVEVHSEALHVLEVEPYSPAARAGIKVGDRIVGIGPERVAHMGAQDAKSALSLANERRQKLAVTDDQGRNEHEVELDGGLLWLVL